MEKKSGGLFSGLQNKFNKIKRMVSILFFVLLGGLLFNLDRAGDFGIMLLKYKNWLPRSVVSFLPGGNAGDGAAVPDEKIAGRVIEVYDGDTATVLAEAANRKYKVRFFGIDAPEAAQNGGIASRDALRDKILGKNVVVKVVSVDNYRRAVGKVMLGGRYINLEMVAEGHAWYYRDYAQREYDLASAEAEARTGRAGLWRDSAPQPPWEYRRKFKK